VLWLVAIALGLGLGLGAGGKLSNLTRLRFRWPLLLLVAVLIREVVIFSPASRLPGAQYVYALSLVLIVLWTIWHLNRLPGVWLVTLGGLLNLLVVLANGGHMTVARELAESQLNGELVRRGTIGQYTLMTADTHLNWLGDWISLRPIIPEGYSPGDLLIALGVALIILVALVHPPQSRFAL
jgi:Family of unknown function (DUF5317)